MLARNIRIEEDLIDQLFNSSENAAGPDAAVYSPVTAKRIPHTRYCPQFRKETLAEMVGTTRSRVNFFMNKFRKLGFIKYNGVIEINTSLLSVVLHD